MQCAAAFLVVALAHAHLAQTKQQRAPLCPDPNKSPQVPRSDPGCVRYYKHHYRVGCDRHHSDTACNCFYRDAPSGGPSGVFVDCSNLGLTDLMPPRTSAEPTPSPSLPPTADDDHESYVMQTYPPANVFYANGNSLTSIGANTFGYQPELRYLYLHNNPSLVHIEPGAFGNMTNLRELLLHFTNLEVLPAGIFDDLPRLKILWAHNTGNLHYAAPGVFSQLTSLEWLRLENNNLSMSSLDYEQSKLWPDSLRRLFLTGNERMEFKQNNLEQACCSLCGVSQSANVKAENDMDFLKTCKTTGKGSCDSKPKVQTLACCGYRNCSAHCKYDYSTDTECSYWQLNVGAGAATRANLAVTLLLSLGVVCMLW